MEIENVTKAPTFKNFLHQSYKNRQLLFFVKVCFNYFRDPNMKHKPIIFEVYTKTRIACFL